MQAEECRCGGGWEQGSKLNEESKERKRPEVKRVAGRGVIHGGAYEGETEGGAILAREKR